MLKHRENIRYWWIIIAVAGAGLPSSVLHGDGVSLDCHKQSRHSHAGAIGRQSGWNRKFTSLLTSFALLDDFFVYNVSINHRYEWQHLKNEISWAKQLKRWWFWALKEIFDVLKLIIDNKCFTPVVRWCFLSSAVHGRHQEVHGESAEWVIY